MTPGFSRLTIKGFRRLRDVDLHLRPLNVLIGVNGVGKSSILDVFDLLAASASGNLAATMAEMGGMNSLLTKDGKTTSVHLQLRSHQEAVPALDYDVRLTRQGYGYVISEEVLEAFGPPASTAPGRYIDSREAIVEYWHDGKIFTPDWDYKRLETALSQTPKMYREAEGFRRRVDDISEIYHGLNVSQNGPVRQPQIVSSASTPGVDGASLVSCLYTIRETEHDRFEAIEDAIRAAFPTFERLDFPPLSAGRITIAWHERGFTEPFFPNELSEGTLRFIWLVTLLQSPGLPEITLIDEPEVSLHPGMLRLLTELMREASLRTQLIVATHSDRFVRFLEPSELMVCDKDESGGMTAEWADKVDLKDWLEDYTLDQLWSQGIIGGRS